jgi:hypothetical protein
MIGRAHRPVRENLRAKAREVQEMLDSSDRTSRGPSAQAQSRKRSAELSGITGVKSSKSARLNDSGHVSRQLATNESAPRTLTHRHASVPAAFGLNSTLGDKGSGFFQPAENNSSCYTCGQTGHTTEQHDQHTARDTNDSHSTSSANEYQVKSQVVIRLTLEGHGGTQLVVFSEKHSRDRFFEKVRKRFRSDDVLSVTIRPNSTYNLPKERKIGIDEAGRQAWDMMRFDSIALSRCVEESYGSVEVSARVQYGG